MSFEFLLELLSVIPAKVALSRLEYAVFMKVTRKALSVERFIA